MIDPHDEGKLLDAILVVLLAIAVAAAFTLSATDLARGAELGAWEDYDCLNRDLQAATGDALVRAKHQGGRANLRYVTLYGVEPADRIRYAAALSGVLHQLSHASVAIHPRYVTDHVLAIDLDQYDPHGVGWAKGWELIVARDRRYHAPLIVLDSGHTGGPAAVADQGLHVGVTIEVKCTDGIFRAAEIVEVDGKGGFRFAMFGNTYNYGPRTEYRRIAAVKAFVPPSDLGVVTGEWIDHSAHKLLSEITHSHGPILDIRDVLYWVCRDAETYYTFRNTPKTLAEWQKKWGVLASPSEFGTPNVRGANLDESKVTGTVRGLERGKLGVWTSYDADKAKVLDAGRDPFACPDRTARADAYEALAITPNGGIDCFIANADQQRINAVPASVAIDTSVGHVRELIPPQSCWHCHTRKRGGEETSGFLGFVNKQKPPLVKDRKLAAALRDYYGDQAKLLRDMLRDREDFRAGIHAATSTGNNDHIEPSDLFAIVEDAIAEVSIDRLTPLQACRELCLPVQRGEPAHDVLSRWLNGTTSAALVALMDGENVHYERFRLEMPEALYRIHERKVFNQ